MRTANLSKYSHRLLSFLCAICFFLFFPIVARAQNYDFSGTWNFNSFISGPGAPWWERGTLTVARDGTFTGSGTQSNGASDSPSGSLSISSNGIAMSVNGLFTTSLCMADSSNSIISCTETLPDGSSGLIILTQQSTSTSLADLAGTWEGSILSSGPTSSLEQVSETVNSDGTFTGTYTKSDGTTTSTSGTLSISPTGEVTCASGDCSDPTYASFVNPLATVMVGTRGAATSSEDANIIVLTRQATSSYSITKLVGIWEDSSLASGPGAPWWQSGLLFINPDGTCSLSSVTGDGTSSNQNGAVSISPAGVITLKLGSTAVGVVDPNMDVMVLTSTWPDGETNEISILTNGSSAALGMAPAATWSTGATPPTPTNSNSPSSPSSPDLQGNFGAPGSAALTHARGAGAAGSLKSVSNTEQRSGAMQPASLAATGLLPGPTEQSAPRTPVAMTNTSEANQAPTPRESVPGPPRIVVVTPGNSQALVNFKLPSNDGGQPITQCTVTANPGDIKTTRVGSPIRVSGLQNGASYTFKVTAANRLGTSPPSQNSTSITPGEVPDAPKILAVKAANGQAEISFKVPGSNGGSNITSYTVTSSSGQKSSGTRSPITVKGLSDGRPYTFTVTATNRIGTSPPSSASQSVTPR